MSQILKFRLTDDNIFDFEYSKYSDFIDNLEPEPGIIINVLEPFTLEDFETAHLEYHKFVKLKEKIEDIITTRKLWSKYELKELSKYDLDNPVLEWLMIRETREDKEIKEKLSLDSFYLQQIKNDNIILYYLIPKSNEELFYSSCSKGHIKTAQWLFNLGDLNIVYDDFLKIFQDACRYGHLDILQWLYTFEYSKNMNISNYEELFMISCSNGHLEVAQWIYTINDIEKIDIHLEGERFFRSSCYYGHLEVAQWLYSLGGVNIHIFNNMAFIWACKNGHLNVAQWLYSLGGFYKDGVYSIEQPILDWLATLE